MANPKNIQLGISSVFEEDINKLSEEVKAWAEQTRTLLTRSAQNFQKGKTNAYSRKGQVERKLAKSIRTRVYTNGLFPERIAFSFPTHGAYRELGIGKGRPLGSPKAIPYRWFGGIIDHQLPQLADITAERFLELTTNTIYIFNSEHGK